MADLPEPAAAGARYDPDLRVYVRPLALEPAAAGGGRPLAGTRLAFHALEAILRTAPRRIERVRLPLLDAEPWAAERGILARLGQPLVAASAPRPDIAGLTPDRPRLMGIVNVTPDSFSDGGDFFDPARAVEHGLALREAGADILDVGGESTRPGAEPVPAGEERRRVVPVIRALAEAGAVVSADTRRADTMQAALDAGARMLNDVSALTHDPASPGVAAASGVPVVIMHMLGEPGTMQQAPAYDDVALDIYDFLEARIAACAAAGLPRERLIVDPGIGFGKTVGHNLALLRELAVFHGLGCPLLVGASRKRFLGSLSRDEPPKERLAGSIAAALAAAGQGAHILRVHDVAETAQALAVAQAIVASKSNDHSI
jgi:dihydropteroate synthase